MRSVRNKSKSRDQLLLQHHENSFFFFKQGDEALLSLAAGVQTAGNNMDGINMASVHMDGVIMLGVNTAIHLYVASLGFTVSRLLNYPSPSLMSRCLLCPPPLANQTWP